MQLSSQCDDNVMTKARLRVPQAVTAFTAAMAYLFKCVYLGKRFKTYGK